MNQHKQPILDKVREVVALAQRRYGFDIRFQDLDIKFVEKGRAAAQASHRRMTNQYGLKFSLESADLDIKEMLEDTIPHEVAHLVNFYDSSTGSNHDGGWISTCIALGGSGARCHTQVLTKAKYRKSYVYVTSSGNERIIKSAAKHNRIQRGATYTIRRTGETYGASHFSHIISAEANRKAHEAVVTQYRASNGKAASPVSPTPVPQASHTRPTPAVKVPKTGSKKARAQTLYDAYKGQGRQAIMLMFIQKLDMSKAGASTYYNTCKNA